MSRPADPKEPAPLKRASAELELARRRRDQAAQGSPDWDAASEAVIELEAEDPASFAEGRARKLFLVRPRQTN
jgi:hypothetical protein